MSSLVSRHKADTPARSRALVVLWGLLTISIVSDGAAWADVYVAPRGSDANPGTERAPVRTLERARDIVRAQLRSSRSVHGDLSVWLHGGTYAIARTLRFGQEDSGESGRRIVYRAQRIADPPVLIGGVRGLELQRLATKDLENAVPLPLRVRLWKVPLPKAASYDPRQAQPIGVGLAAAPAPPELSCGPISLAYVRAPRSGWYAIHSVMAANAVFTGVVDVGRWQLDNAWLHGYWGHEWADALVPVRGLGSTMTTLVTQPLPQGLFSYTPGSRWQLFNAPELLGAAGEYFMDFARQTAYLLLPDHCAADALTVSTLTQPLIRVEHARYLAFEGLTIAATRGDGLLISAADHITVSGCSVRDVGGTGISITGGSDNRVSNCALDRIGRTAILVGGGDRATLAPAMHRIEGNDIHDYGLWVGAYSAGVDLYGVGVEVAGNRIHSAPHNAIRLSGNNHTIEGNEIFSVVRDTGDAGAIYAGRDLFMRGNVIRRNFLHDNGGGIAGGVSGVYLDDMFSGVTIESNVFVRSGQCVFIGGGRDNLVKGNLFVGCEPAVHLDDRGVSSHAALARRSRRQDGWGLLDDRVRYLKSDRYLRSYPELGELAGEHALEPRGNLVVANFFAGAPLLVNADAPRIGSWFKITGNNELVGLSADADIDTIKRWVAAVPALQGLYFGAERP